VEDASLASARAKVNIRNPASAIARCHAECDLSTDEKDH